MISAALTLLVHQTVTEVTSEFGTSVFISVVVRPVAEVSAEEFVMSMIIAIVQLAIKVSVVIIIPVVF